MLNRSTLVRTATATALLLLAVASFNLAADEKKRPDLDVPFVPTPQEVVDKMLEVAKVTDKDVVYDLGCGNGIIVVTAAKKYGCKAVGFDIDPDRIKESNDNVKKNEVGKLVEIKNQNIFETDLSKASVVTMYLLPSVNEKMVPQLKKLKPGSRIVSHAFKIEGYPAEKEFTVTTKDGRECTVYLWTAPLKKAKE